MRRSAQYMYNIGGGGVEGEEDALVREVLEDLVIEQCLPRHMRPHAFVFFRAPPLQPLPPPPPPSSLPAASPDFVPPSERDACPPLAPAAAENGKAAWPLGGAAASESSGFGGGGGGGGLVGVAVCCR